MSRPQKYLWTTEQLAYLKRWYPHWGTKAIAEDLQLTKAAIISKRTTLRLPILPKTDRICRRCKINYQWNNSHAGYLCRDCFNKHHKERRVEFNAQLDPLTRKLQSCLRAINDRNVSRHKGTRLIKLQDLYTLYEKQKGRCFYTGYEMSLTIQPWHEGDDLTVDRIDSRKPYQLDNLVLCTWWANCAKGTLSVDEFIKRCDAVVCKIRN